MCSHQTTLLVEKNINSVFTFFGQLLAHDLSSTAHGSDDDGGQVKCHCNGTVTDKFCMSIPTPDMPGQMCINFPRSSDFYKREEDCHLGSLNSNENLQ